MPGLIPGIHGFLEAKTWMAGTGPAMTAGFVFDNPRTPNKQRKSTWPKFSFSIIPPTATSKPWRMPSPKAPAKPAPGRHQARARTGAAEVAKASYYKLDQAAPVAKIEELANYDAIIVGTGTRFGRMSSQMANFLDQAGGLWMKGALHGKVGGAFTSTATQHGGQETTLFSIITNLLHFGMTIVGLNYGFAGQMKLDEVTGGSPYGATTITGGDGSRQPSENELAGARYQGRVIAETAKKLHG